MLLTIIVLSTTEIGREGHETERRVKDLAKTDEIMVAVWVQESSSAADETERNEE